MTKIDERTLTVKSLEMNSLIPLLRRPGFLVPGPRQVRVCVAILLLLIGATATTRLIETRGDALPDGAVFRLDGKVFTEQQLEQRAALVEFLYGVTKPDAAAKADEFNRALAKAVAVSLIVERAAQSRSIVIADKAASDKLEKMIADSGTSRRTFIQQLGSHGLSEADILREIKFQQANEQLFAQVTKDIKPTTDEEAKKYFDDHSAEMATPEYRNLANIVVSTKDQAEQVALLARSGRRFPALVTKYSIDESTRGKDGSLGTVEANQLEDAYAAAAFSARKGSVFGPVETPQGWNVGRVDDIQPSTPLDFATIKDALMSRLTYDAQLKSWNAFLVDQVKAAHVTYASNYRPADPDEVPSQSVGVGDSPSE
ncbi:peptidyl-prolyl cis-trans isomerase [Nocardioides sp. GCM10030258]|uniref:peptidyl-prolyl cis-trans isomerase n=1 Tax=unclassified Nocardioides TaxID=2615069 RepID=UPI00361A1255